MTVKFEFTLSDVDAENLLGILQDEIARSEMKALGSFISATALEGEWYAKHANYLKVLKQIVACGSIRVV